MQGENAFISNSNNSYSKEFKTIVVEEYLSGKESIEKISIKYCIRSKNTLKHWISLYNSDMELKNYEPKQEIYMAEVRRKTTFDKHFYNEKNWSINWMYKQLGITRSAYYKWVNRPVPKQEQENMKLAELIRDYDERFGHILGYRRMTAWINHFNGTHYGKNRVHRIMKKWVSVLL